MANGIWPKLLTRDDALDSIKKSLKSMVRTAGCRTVLEPGYVISVVSVG